MSSDIALDLNTYDDFDLHLSGASVNPFKTPEDSIPKTSQNNSSMYVTGRLGRPSALHAQNITR